jgi:hypothetical protein
MEKIHGPATSPMVEEIRGIYIYINGFIAGWWFGTWLIFFLFSWDFHDPDELIFFRGVETTNQIWIDRFAESSQVPCGSVIPMRVVYAGLLYASRLGRYLHGIPRVLSKQLAQPMITST